MNVLFFLKKKFFEEYKKKNCWVEMLECNEYFVAMLEFICHGNRCCECILHKKRHLNLFLSIFFWVRRTKKTILWLSYKNCEKRHESGTNKKQLEKIKNMKYGWIERRKPQKLKRKKEKKIWDRAKQFNHFCCFLKMIWLLILKKSWVELMRRNMFLG